MPAVSVRDLVVRFGSRPAVAGLGFDAPHGQVTAIVGPNGAGKSTTVAACVGLVTGWAGRIALLGSSRDPARTAPAAERARVGVMLQDGGLYPSARPGELVAYVASLHPDPLDPAALLDQLGLDPGTRTPIRRLSGGEQQRVKCALALVGRPDLAFLDEPTAGLDAEGRRAFHGLVRGLRDAGTSIVLTTHLMDDVERLADRVVVVARGRDVRSGTLDDLVGDEDCISFSGPLRADLGALASALPPGCQIVESRPGRYRATGASDPLALSAIASWTARHGARSSSITVGRESLEDVVLDLVGRQP
ncbi:MAG: ABC transporter ATP-binding protein [Candidatus Nanopelagicales bacterium]